MPPDSFYWIVHWQTGFDSYSGKPADNLRGQIEQALCEESALEKSRRLDVIRMSPVQPDVIQVDRELRRIQRPILPQIFTWSDDLIPGFEPRHAQAFYISAG